MAIIIIWGLDNLRVAKLRWLGDPTMLGDHQGRPYYDLTKLFLMRQRCFAAAEEKWLGDPTMLGDHQGRPYYDLATCFSVMTSTPQSPRDYATSVTG